MKKIFSIIILITLLLSAVGCIPAPTENESTPLPSPTEGFSLSVGEEKDGLFTCRGASDSAVVVSSDEVIARVIAYKVESIGKVSYKIIGKKAGTVTISVKSGADGVTLDNHTYTVKQ